MERYRSVGIEPLAADLRPAGGGKSQARLTIIAVLSRQQAEHNRSQAEDLVGFMLTDLREKPELIGKLDYPNIAGDLIDIECGLPIHQRSTGQPFIRDPTIKNRWN